MTTLLAIETSTELASVALIHAGQLWSHELDGVQTHSANLIPAIESILKSAELDLSELQALAFGCGPGAFTGVRTACGVVQGLAFGLGIPVLPVTGLEAMALALVDQQTRDNPDKKLHVLTVLDARMGEVYWAHFCVESGQTSVLSAPALSSLDGVLNYLNASIQSIDHLALGTGVEAMLDLSAWSPCLVLPHARQILQAGLRDFKLGKAVSAQHAQPLYLRNKIALTTQERQLQKLANQHA